MTGTVAFLALLAVTVAAWAITWRRDCRAKARANATARDNAAARAEAIARHPSRVPELGKDGEPLDESPGGEAEQFAALIYAYRHGRIAEPGNPPRQEQGK